MFVLAPEAAPQCVLALFFFFFVSVIMIVLFFSPPLSLLFGVVGLVNKYIGFFQLAQTGWLFFVVVV